MDISAPVLTIDGPSGSGKGTISRIVAQRLGWHYLDSGALYPVTNTIDTYVYRSLMKLNNISMASAASAFQSVVGFIVVVAVNALVRKMDKDNALF